MQSRWSAQNVLMANLLLRHFLFLVQEEKVRLFSSAIFFSNHIVLWMCASRVCNSVSDLNKLLIGSCSGTAENMEHVHSHTQARTSVQLFIVANVLPWTFIVIEWRPEPKPFPECSQILILTFQPKKSYSMLVQNVEKTVFVGYKRFSECWSIIYNLLFLSIFCC